MKFHPDKQLFQAAGKPELYLYIMGDPLLEANIVDKLGRAE